MGQPYRNGGNNNNAKKTVNKRSSNDDDGISSPGGSRFSPVTQPETNSTKQKSSSSLVSPSQNKNDTKRRENFDRDMSMNDNRDDLFGDNNSSNHDDDDDDNNKNDGDGDDDDDDDDDDDVDLFGNASKKLLKIDVDLDRASTATKSTSGHSKKKRRRSSNELATDGGIAVIASKSRRRSLTLLSTNSLMELWNQVSSLQTSYERACGKINEINSVNDNSGDDSTKNRGIDTLIGDELLEEYKKVLGYEHQIEYQRRELHSIAQKRRSLELEAVRYLPWLERALQHDQEDIDFCDKYRKQLDLYHHVYEPSKLARDHRLREERHRQEKKKNFEAKKKKKRNRKNLCAV